MPKMTTAQKRTFISQDLCYELRCLLGACTLWEASRIKNNGFDVVTAMDSAFVHTRCLYKFFTSAKSTDDVSITEFGPDAYASTLYGNWEKALNRHVLHISKGRLSPTNLVGARHLNSYVRDFTEDILSLWSTFEVDSKASAFLKEIHEVRLDAVRDAANDASFHGISPLFS